MHKKITNQNNKLINILLKVYGVKIIRGAQNICLKYTLVFLLALWDTIIGFTTIYAIFRML